MSIAYISIYLYIIFYKIYNLVYHLYKLYLVLYKRYIKLYIINIIYIYSIF
jgi:hypothetical protein